MNLPRTARICMTSLMTAVSGLLAVQAMDFATTKVLTNTFIAGGSVSMGSELHTWKNELLLQSYEPPPDIGGPKRTSGSGGRYV